MTTRLKTTLAAAVALAVATSTTVPAMAQNDTIVVESAGALESWSEAVSRSLDKRLVRAEKSLRANPKSGIVQLRFTLNEDGRAHDFKVYRSSGNIRTDLIAKRAVRSLSNLGDVPVRNPQAEQFQANIIFAEGVQEHKKLAKLLRKTEAKRLARGGVESTILTIEG